MSGGFRSTGAPQVVALVAAALIALTGVAEAKKKPAAAPAPSPASATDTSQVLVRIGGEAITRGDVQRRLEEIPEGSRGNFTSPEGRQRAGVPERAKVQQQIAQQRRDLVIRTYLTELMATNPAPGDSELKAYYNAHLDEYKIPASASIRHIMLKSAVQARSVLALVRAGQDWNKLCLRYSTDSLTRSNGGNLGAVTHEGQFAVIGHEPALAESVFARGAGKVGGPWKSAKGWHLIKIEDVHADSERPFESMKGMILRQLSTQRTQDFYKTQLEGARKTLGVTPDSTAIKSFMSQKKDPHDQFREAQEKGPPEERIAAYRQVIADAPDSEVSPQAAFMVGFIYSEELKNYDEAEKAFRSLITRYPNSELAPSAHWMVAHMRSEEAPAFIESQADSLKAAVGRPASARGTAGKP
jgi:foldase protein PrsA